VIPVLSFDSPVVSLLRGADGKNNWTFRNDDKPSPWQLELQRVIFSKGSVHLIDAIKHADMTADIDTINADPIYGVAWQLRGKFNGETVSETARLAPCCRCNAKLHPTRSWPICASDKP